MSKYVRNLYLESFEWVNAATNLFYGQMIIKLQTFQTLNTDAADMRKGLINQYL